MDFRNIIAARRDGKVHSGAELKFLADGAANGSIPDYQLSAWLMAAVLNPLSLEETADLTMAMAESGERLDLSELPHPWVDKHSTGGVGDKTSIVLLPLLASCGLTMLKMSGRGLGITGGTVDKLESVPGFRMDLSPEEMIAQAKRIGVAVTGQTPRLAPADKVLYALRDATATVASMPLIASSILSKKIAGGAEVVVIDLKCGSGAFMKTLDSARRLAEMMLEAARMCGLKLSIVITDMDQPLGSAVGNALEVAEALDVLEGTKMESRFSSLCRYLSGVALWTTGKAQVAQDAQPMAQERLASGAALDRAAAWFQAQGSTFDVRLPRPGDRLRELRSAPVRQVVEAHSNRFVSRIDAASIGQIAVALGGGRVSKTDPVDPTVGIEMAIEVGAHVVSGFPLATIHARTTKEAEFAATALQRAIEFSESPVAKVDPVIELVS